MFEARSGQKQWKEDADEREMAPGTVRQKVEKRVGSKVADPEAIFESYSKDPLN